MAIVVFGIFRCVRKIAKDNYWFGHVCLSVCPYRTTWLTLDEFS
jgi:hypothetical protein